VSVVEDGVTGGVMASDEFIGGSFADVTSARAEPDGPFRLRRSSDAALRAPGTIAASTNFEISGGQADAVRPLTRC
jgi:hypothetical protein